MSFQISANWQMIFNSIEPAVFSSQTISSLSYILSGHYIIYYEYCLLRITNCHPFCGPCLCRNQIPRTGCVSLVWFYFYGADCNSESYQLLCCPTYPKRQPTISMVNHLLPHPNDSPSQLYNNRYIQRISLHRGRDTQSRYQNDFNLL